MHLYFYKNLEFINGHPNNIADGQEKGTLYVEILNQLDNVLEWLNEFLILTKNNKTNYLEYPHFILKKENENLFYAIRIIQKSISDLFFKYKDNLKDLKSYYNHLNNDEYYNKMSKEYQGEYKESIKISIESNKNIITNKERIVFIINSYIRFLKRYNNKVDYFIIKDLNLKSTMSHNQINSLFSSTIELPAYVKTLYYENNGSLKKVSSSCLNLTELTEEKYYKKRVHFFENEIFNYLNTYNISNIFELMNVYFNEFINNKIPLRKCKNCGKYFIPNNKQLYCDNPSPQNKNKTCRLLSNDIKANSDKIYEAYRKTYKTQHNKLKRYLDTGNINKENLKERFNKWNEIAKSKKETCKTVDEYNKWYKSSLNWIEDFK